MKIRYFLLTLIVSLSFTIAHSQSWKSYPYHQNGSVLNFPRDEGYHPGEVVEWWYTNAHFTGDSTGTDYSAMFTFFYYPTLGFDGFRIFELSNETTGDFLTETQPCQYPTLSQTELNIRANTGLLNTVQEEWKTLTDSIGNLLPFQYQLTATMPNGSIDITYNCIKRPLMVGGTGFLYEGITGYTYYYSETELVITGTVTMNGVTEPIHGTAWIDRQWGQFNPNNGEQYTWMSLQLSNGMDFNLWNIFNAQSQIPDTSTYRFCSVYVNDSTDTTFSDFTLDRLKYVYTSDNQRCYDQKWHFTKGNIDLTLTATHSNNEVQLPFRFFEGSLAIEGTVDGAQVTGVGYVELLHSFSKPQVIITSPTGHVGWMSTTPVTWRLTNPDDGRPVWYDLFVSTDNQVTFTPIATQLTDTSYLWTPSLPIGTEGWFRIKAYSIDTTLVNTTTSGNSFIYGVSGIKDLISGNSVKVFPNPFTDATTIQFELHTVADVMLTITDINGKLVRKLEAGKLAAGKHQFDWEDNVTTGVYNYRLQANNSFITGKLVKQ